VFTNNPDPKNKNEYKKDPTLQRKLETTLKDEFFSYIVDCSHKFLNCKNRSKALEQPEALKNERDDYIVKIDKLSSFIKDKCEKGDKAFLPRSEFRRQFEKYLKDRGMFKPCEHDILEDMKTRFTLGRNSVGIWGYKGIKISIKPEDEDDDKPTSEVSNDDYEHGIEKKDHRDETIKSLQASLQQRDQQIAKMSDEMSEIKRYLKLLVSSKKDSDTDTEEQPVKKKNTSPKKSQKQTSKKTSKIDSDSETEDSDTEIEDSETEAEEEPVKKKKVAPKTSQKQTLKNTFDFLGMNISI